MSRFTTRELEVQGEQLLVLREEESGAEAQVWPGFGNNLVSLSLPDRRGHVLNLIRRPDHLADLRTDPSRYGTPILFPWCGRIPQGKFTYHNHHFTARNVDHSGNAAHGFVKDRVWDVQNTRVDEEGACVTCSIDSDRVPPSETGFPFPFQLSVTYHLMGDVLMADAKVRNTGASRLPFGIGFHPYFEMFLDEKGSLKERFACVPADEICDLKTIATLDKATGKPWKSAVSGEHDLRNPVGVGEHRFDGVYTSLLSQKSADARLIDTAAGSGVAVRGDEAFKYLVIYTPEDRRRLCLEPWTCPPNAFNIHALGQDAGIIEIGPGEEWSGSVSIFCIDPES